MEEKEKTQGQLRREALLDVRKNGYDRLSTGEEAAMKAYCEDAGVRFVRIRDRSELAGVERFLVFGSPSGEDLAGEIIRASLSEKEMKDANTMGKGVLAEKTWEGKPVLIFATAYSINSFVKGHAEDWKDIFENWYYIARSITSIIGY